LQNNEYRKTENPNKVRAQEEIYNSFKLKKN